MYLRTLVLLFFVIPKILFANHIYDYGVKVTELCKKTDGELYYSETQNLSNCRAFGVLIEEFTNQKSIAKAIGLIEGDIIIGYDGNTTKTLIALDRVYNKNLKSHDHEIKILRYNSNNGTFFDKSISFTVQNQTAFITKKKKETQNKIKKVFRKQHSKRF